MERLQVGTHVKPAGPAVESLPASGPAPVNTAAPPRARRPLLEAEPADLIA